MGQEVGLPCENLVDRDAVKVTVDTSENKGNHLVDGHGRVLLLLEKLGQLHTGILVPILLCTIHARKTYAFTTAEGLLGGSIKIGTELGESSDLTVLGQEELQGASDLLHGLELSSGTDTRHGQTDVDGRSDTLVEQLSLQEDLAVSNGNDVGGNVSRDITTLCLNDGQGSHGTTTKLVVHLGSTLQQTGVEVEDITGVSLTSGGTTEQQRHLTVSNGLLGQIVINDESVLARISEVLSDGGT